jgi:hypothetical protein
VKKGAKILLLAGGTAGIIWGVSKISDLKKLSDSGDELVLEVKGPHKIQRKGMNLAFDVDLYFANPTKQKITLNITMIKVIYKGEEVGYTKPSTQVIVINPKSEATLPGIQFRIGIIGALTTAFDFLFKDANFAQNTTLKIYMTVNGINLIIDKPLKD